MSSDRKQCFVIMPFSDTSPVHTEKYWTEHFQSFLKPIIEESAQWEAHRSKPMRGDIIRQIITDLVVSPLVVADLTDLNPNVFWELGVRQSFRHCTVTVAQEGTKLPFDISSKGTIFYRDSHTGNEDFIVTFQQAIENCLTEPERPDSNVLETVTGRGSLFEIVHQAELLRRVDALEMEQSLNEDMLKSVNTNVKKNKGKTANEKHMVSTRFSSACTELLITNRYLDENKDFYRIAVRYFLRLNQLNDALRHWLGKEEHMENWFEKSMQNTCQCFEEYKKAIAEAKRKLSERGSILK
jgi:hypothetical protein